MSTTLEMALPLPATARRLAIDVRPGVDLHMVCYDHDDRAVAHYTATVPEMLWRTLLMPAIRSHCAHLNMRCEVREIRPKGHPTSSNVPPLAAPAAH